MMKFCNRVQLMEKNPKKPTLNKNTQKNNKKPPNQQKKNPEPPKTPKPSGQFLKIFLFLYVQKCDGSPNIQQVRLLSFSPVLNVF